MIRKNKILLFSALGILGVGVASTICWSIVKTQESQKESKQIIKANQFNLVEGEVDSFETSSKNMLAAKTATYYKNVLGYSDDKVNEEVENIVGSYNALYDDSIEQNKQLYKEGLVGSVEDANYAALNTINYEFNIEPVDIPKTESNLQMLKQSVQNETEKNKINENANLYNSEIIPVISEYNLTDIEASLLFNNNYKDSSEENNLQVMAEKAKEMIGKTITIKDDIDSNFASKLKVYSTDGNTGYFAANNNDPIDDLKGISANDLIDANDMGDLFNMEYDLTQNTIFKKTPDNVDYDSINENDVNVNEDEIIAPFIQKLPMSGISVPGGADYAPGEFEPGYQLLTKMVSEDYITNSDYDTITLKFGVWDKAYDMDQEHVIWLEDDLNMAVNINVASINQKRNIANNYYYTQLETVPCNDFYDEENKEYFKVNQEESNRATINVALEGASIKENGEYDIDESNPYYIDPNSVNLEGISVPSGSWYYNGGHTNEALKLKVVDINTNVSGDNNQALKCIWSICDTDPQTGKYVWVKDIQWINHNEPIWINFNYNEEDANKIALTIEQTKVITDIYQVISLLGEKDLNSIDAKAQELWNINFALSTIAITGAAIADALCALMTVVSVFTFGVNVVALITLLVTSAIDITFAILTMQSISLSKENLKSIHELTKMYNSMIENIDMDLMETISDWYNKLTNPKFNINSKLEIVDSFQQLKDSLGTKWDEFEKTMFNISGLGEEKYEEFKDIKNSSINKVKYWSIIGAITVAHAVCFIQEVLLVWHMISPNSGNYAELKQALQGQLSQAKEAGSDTILATSLLEPNPSAPGPGDSVAKQLEKLNKFEDSLALSENTNAFAVAAKNIAVSPICPILIAIATGISVLASIALGIINSVYKIV